MPHRNATGGMAVIVQPTPPTKKERRYRRLDRAGWGGAPGFELDAGADEASDEVADDLLIDRPSIEPPLGRS